MQKKTVCGFRVVVPSKKNLWQKVLELKVEFPLAPLEKGALNHVRA